MKECAICGEILDDNAIRCSQGHSSFKPKKEKKGHSAADEMIRITLLESSVSYTSEEVDYLVAEIKKICAEARVPVTKELVTKIKNDIEKRSQQRKQTTSSETKTRRVQEKRTGHIVNNDADIDDIERTISVFRGINNDHVRGDDLIQLLADALNVSAYNKFEYSESGVPNVFPYEDNKVFWQDALNGNLKQGNRVQLRHFHLTEWIPSSPGRYYSPEAETARRRAKRYVAYGRDEYIPLGKEEMVLGGVGCVRLGIRTTHLGSAYLLGASSTGIAHQGIPIFFSENLYDRLLNSNLWNNGCIAYISGRIQVFPTHDFLVQYDQQIPRFCIFADEFNIIDFSENILVTVAITFSPEERHHREDYLRKYWSFCSFNPANQDVQEAADWLEHYVRRYSGRAESILGDFDELYQHFSTPIEFPLAEVMVGRIDQQTLRDYQRVLGGYRGSLHFTIVEGDYYAMGHNFSNSDFRNAIVNIDSTLTNVTQTIGTLKGVDDQAKQELEILISQLKDALKQVPSGRIDEAQTVARRAEELVTEASQQKPDKEAVEFKANKLKQAAENIASVAPIVVGIALQIVSQIVRLGS